MENASAGKKKKLVFLSENLGLTDKVLDNIRYQLFHRTVSALLEAKRFNACYAMMIVHSFSPTGSGFDDYQAFLGLFGQSSQMGNLVELSISGTTRLFSGWVSENGAVS